MPLNIFAKFINSDSFGGLSEGVGGGGVSSAPPNKPGIPIDIGICLPILTRIALI